jgi:hypothetical protein
VLILAGLDNPDAAFALRLELETPHLAKHPFLREYEILSTLVPHPNITRVWSKFEEEEIAPRVMKRRPEFILTMFDDKLQINRDWRPKVQEFGTVVAARVVPMAGAGCAGEVHFLGFSQRFVGKASAIVWITCSVWYIHCLGL